jgi:hypothetical protein
MPMPRTVTIVMEPDPDLQPTRTVFRAVQAAWSPVARTDGRPRRSIPPLTGMERGGMLPGRVTVTRAVPAPGGTVPVGIDRNDPTALVAAVPDGTTFVAAGTAVTVANGRVSNPFIAEHSFLPTRPTAGFCPSLLFQTPS